MTTRRPSGAAVHRARRRASALLLAAALAVAACGGDDSGDASPATDQDPDPGTAVGSAAPAPAIAVDDLAVLAGGAPAVADVGLEDPPGATERTGLPDVSETAASVTAPDGSVTGCCLLVAADSATRQRGLMEVTDLAGYQGMVFVWDTDSSGGFWMKNTVMPLSIAYFTADGRYIDSYDMEPCPDGDLCESYPSPGTYRFAVEVPQGELDDLGIGPGSRLTLGGDCAQPT